MNTGRRGSILVVDDIPANIAVISDTLKQAGYQVRAANSGRRALDIISSSTPPDLVLLDIMMPDMDGYEVCRQITEDPFVGDLPVIFVTSLNDEIDEKRGFECGAIDYITKPIKPELLLARLSSHLDLQTERRRNAELATQLSHYISPNVSESISRGSRRAVLESRRRHLTVFFSDIVGFTDRSEQMQPEHLSTALNEYLHDMSEIAIEFGGTVDKFIGDAVMVFFGDPSTKGMVADAKACVDMALKMQRRIDALADSWGYSGAGPFAVRMGISSGYCTVGNFGCEHLMQYTALGSIVNLASRLESNAGPGEILVDEQCWSLVGNEFEGVSCDPIQVKGFSHPQVPMKILAESDREQVLLKGEGFNLDIDINKANGDPKLLEALKDCVARLSAERNRDRE